MIQPNEADDFFNDVFNELKVFESEHLPFTSFQLGFSALLDEFMNLWSEVGKHPHCKISSLDKVCKKIAALSLRFYLDLLR